jgi:ribosome-associated protein
VKTARIDFLLRGDHIPLDALLKATGLAESGGRAKAMVAAGGVQVDGRQELRKTCKLRAGQVVALQHARIRVLAEAPKPLPAGDDG